MVISGDILRELRENTADPGTQANAQLLTESYEPGKQAAMDLQRQLADMAGAGNALDLSEAAGGIDLLDPNRRRLTLQERASRCIQPAIEFFGWSALAAALARGRKAKKAPGTTDSGAGSATSAAPASTWTRPPGWRLPKNGTWSGIPGHSDFIPNNPRELGIPPGTSIPFRNGYPDFSQWSRGNYNIPGLNGDHSHDLPLIWEAVARQQGLPNQTAGRRWLRDQNLTPHHAGGNAVQLIPSSLHTGVQHTGGAWELRNQ
jgi:hypothetical protein